MFQNSILWEQPPADLRLSLNEVHIWRGELDLPAPQIDDLGETLSADECDRAKRFYFERDRQRFIAGRGMLRNILSRYLAIAPSQMEFCYGKRGKPALRNESICFNLSHSQGLALYAITLDRIVGIDLEQVRSMPDAEAIAKSFFSQREYAVLQGMPANEKQAAFLNCWTRKEAFLKAIGDGLYKPLDQIEVSFLPDEPARLLSIAGDVESASRWSILHLIPAAGYVGALAIEGDSFRLSHWQWSPE
ncbi:MAG: 4'-phosphopantetheinyl transferase superfamily protein [Microcoleus vaginatus WJT46-NPBG5]|jgi:4'-phosphopantetheinyl transferase|nr:4'-phosphopantetheinyl transferase superfamily protein [Microcoleus vaginatus WJT46-NPBG5]